MEKSQHLGMKGTFCQRQFSNSSTLNTTHPLPSSISVPNKGTDLIPAEASEVVLGSKI